MITLMLISEATKSKKCWKVAQCACVFIDQHRIQYPIARVEADSLED